MKKTVVVRDVLLGSAVLWNVGCGPVDWDEATDRDTTVDEDTLDSDTAVADTNVQDTADVMPDVIDDGIPVITGDPRSIALPEDTPFILSHPLVYDGKLYVHTGTAYEALEAGLAGLATERLSCYDTESLALLWSTVLTESGTPSPFLTGGDTGMALQRFGDEIPVWSFDYSTELTVMSVVDVFTGELRRQVHIPDHWVYRDPGGELRERSAARPVGAPAQNGRDLIFAEGIAVSLCSGTVNWDNGAWILGDAPPMTHGGRLYVRVPGGGLRVTAFDLSTARGEITGFYEDGTTRLFESEITAGVDGAPNQLLWDSSIVSVRVEPGSDALEAGFYVERWSMDDGSLVERIGPPDALDTAPLMFGYFGSSVVDGTLAVADDVLLIPFHGMHEDGSGIASGLMAVDLRTDTYLHAVGWHGLRASYVPSADYIYGLDAVGNGNGFSVLQFDLRTGEPVARFSDPVFSGPELPTPYSSVVYTNRAPLLVDGQLFVVADDEAGSTLWVLQTGDESAEVHQYLMNNELNPVLNLEDPASAHGPDPTRGSVEPAAPEDTSVDDSGELPEAPTATPVDTPPGDTPDTAVLAALGATTDDLGEWPRSYVALLRDVEYSNDGDEGGNVGEGWLRVETEFIPFTGGCTSGEGETRSRYPASGFVGLWDPTHATMNPDLPVFYASERVMETGEGDLVLRYSALEDDTPQGFFDTVMTWGSRILAVAWGVVTGDYCAVVEAAAQAVEEEASDYTDHYGAAIATIAPGDRGDIVNLYGIMEGEARAEVPVAGSTSRSVLAAAVDAVGAVCGVLDVLDGDIFALENVAASAIDLFDPAEQSTRGRFDLELHRDMRISHLTVTVVDEQLAPERDWRFEAQLGVLGSDPVSDALGRARTVDNTPFIVRFDTPSVGVGETLVDADIHTDAARAGTTAVYFELGAYVEIGGLGSLGGFGISASRFFDDALYGAWEPTDDDHVFAKDVTYVLDGRWASGPITLRFEIELDEG